MKICVFFLLYFVVRIFGIAMLPEMAILHEVTAKSLNNILHNKISIKKTKICVFFLLYFAVRIFGIAMLPGMANSQEVNAISLYNTAYYTTRFRKEN